MTLNTISREIRDVEVVKKEIIKPFRKQETPRYPIVAQFGDHNSNLYHKPSGLVLDMDWLDAGAFINSLPIHTRIFTHSERRAAFAALDARKFTRIRFGDKSSYKYLNKYSFSWEREGDTFHDLIEGVMVAFDFLQKYGINLGGTATTVKKIMGLFVNEPIVVQNSTKAAIGHRGGRNYLYHHGVYHHVDHWDINAAYPHAFTCRTWPTVFYRDHRPNRRLRGDGIAHAQVEVNPIGEGSFTPGPILNSVGILGTAWIADSGISDIYSTFGELRTVRDFGGKVKVLETYTGKNYVPISFLAGFRRFCEAVRAIDNSIARRILKGIINACWSVFSFALNDQTRYRYLDYYGRQIEKTGKIKKPLSPKNACGFPIATIVSGRVRERLYREALYPVTAPVMAKTDSVFSWTDPSKKVGSKANTEPNGPKGNALGEWSKRTEMFRLTLGLSTNEYAYIDDIATMHPIVVASGRITHDPIKFEAQILRDAERGRVRIVKRTISDRVDSGVAEWQDKWLLL